MRKAPKDVQDRLTRAGGRNLFGEPNFRIIWGWEATEFIYSQRSGHYERRPRYIQEARNRWIIEKYWPPEHYGTPAWWRMQFTQNIDGQEIDLLGPFPSRGAYEQLCTLQTPDGEYLDLSSDVCDKVVDLVRASREVSAWDRYNRSVEQIEGRDRKSKEFDSYADDLIRDLQPAFSLQPTVYLGNKNGLRGKYENG